MDSIPEEFSIDVPVYVKRFQIVPDGKVRLSKQQLRHHLRWRLLERLRREHRFQNIIRGDLHKLWKQIQPDVNQNASWKDIPQDSEYAVALTDLVHDKLRLREGGRASWYFLCEIHDIVSRGSRLPQPVMVQTHRTSVELHLSVSTAGDARITQVTTGDDGQPTAAARHINGPYAAFQDWETLRAQAHQDLDTVIDVMKRQFLEGSKDFTPMRSSRLVEIEDCDIAELITFLWARKGATHRRDMRRRLIRDLGLDQVRN